MEKQRHIYYDTDLNSGIFIMILIYRLKCTSLKVSGRSSSVIFMRIM